MAVKVKYRGLPNGDFRQTRPARNARSGMVNAINSSLVSLQSLGQRLMKRRFKSPTRWTLGGQQIRNASNRTLQGTIRMAERRGRQIGAGKYLNTQEVGGQRRGKRSEVKLRSRGVLASGEFVVPVNGGPLDVDPSARGGVYRRMASNTVGSFKELPRTKKGKLRNPAKGNFFRKENKIFLRQKGGKVVLAAVVTRRPSYQPRFGWNQTMRTSTPPLISANFKATIDEAIRRNLS